MIADLLERSPAVVKLAAPIRGWNDTTHFLVKGETLRVEALEADRRGVRVRTRGGSFVSLHPSEFEVIEWAPPEESKAMITSATEHTAERAKGTSAGKGARRGGARDVAPTATATRRRLPANENAAEVAKLARLIDRKTAERKAFVAPGATSTVTPAGIARFDPEAKAATRDDYLIRLAMIIRNQIPRVLAAKIEDAPRDAGVALLIKECSTADDGRHTLRGYGYITTDARIVTDNGDHRFEWYEVLDELLNDLAENPATDEERTITPRTVEVKPVGSSSKKKPPAAAAAAKPAGRQPARVLKTNVLLKLSDLERHPQNRRPTEADVAVLAESMKADGQFDDITVRLLPNRAKAPLYQIVSGETRTLAAKKNGQTEIRGTVIECDDAEALRLVAEHNGRRKDLNPIQRAELIANLCRSIDEGGAGMTREQAAKSVGLASHSAASNLVRLLQLPQVWQERVASGELPESFARALLPLVPAALLFDELERDWQKAHKKGAGEWERRRWENRGDVEQKVRFLMSSETRPTDGKHAHYYSEGEFYGDFPRLFALTDELAAKLQIVDLEIDGKTQPRATNAKLFDKLNLPAIKAKLAEDTKKQARRGGADSKGEPRKLTAAEEKQKAKERAEQLAGRITAWRHQWLKALVAAKLETLPAIRERVLIWLATNPLTCFGLRELVDAPIVRAAKAAGGAGSDPWEAMQGLGTDESLLRDVGQEVVRNVLLAEDRDPKRPNVPFAKLDDLAAMASIDLAAEWKGIQGPAAGEQMRARFESFFELFQTSQLDALGSELGVEVVNQSGKAAKVKRLASYPQVVAKTLPMPKGIKPVAARAARKGKK